MRPLRTVQTPVNSTAASGPCLRHARVPHDNSIANVDEVTDRFSGVGVPRLAQLLELAHDRLPAEVRPRLRPILSHPHDRVRVVQLTKGIHVAGVPRLEEGPHDLHVLLRHRLPAQPGFKSPLAVPVSDESNDLPIAQAVNARSLAQPSYDLQPTSLAVRAEVKEHEDTAIVE